MVEPVETTLLIDVPSTSSGTSKALHYINLKQKSHAELVSASAIALPGLCLDTQVVVEPVETLTHRSCLDELRH